MMPDAAVHDIDRGFCPVCKYRGFILGPRGGAGMNIECGSTDCRTRYNILRAPFSHHVIAAQVIGSDTDWNSIPNLWGPQMDKPTPGEREDICLAHAKRFADLLEKEVGEPGERLAVVTLLVGELLARECKSNAHQAMDGVLTLSQGAINYYLSMAAEMPASGDRRH